MSEHVLAVNAGSSSIKFALYGAGQGADEDRLSVRLRGEIEGIGGEPRLSAVDAHGRPVAPPRGKRAALAHPIATLMQWLDERVGVESLLVAGHRVVFGGLAHTSPARVTPELRARLRALIPFAPLHQPDNLEPIEWLARHHPALAQVACFDTGFHSAAPEVAQRYGLPRELHDLGARRYGFHGLSYEYIASRLPALDPAAAEGRAIVAHLGSGASLCALRGGASIATTMGFSALSGLLMSTRPGELDPGILVWLLRERQFSPAALEALLYHDCGLKGVSGLSGDMRELLASDDARARQAIELFTYRVVREIGSLAAALGGLEALVFTAGIGENAAPIRAAVCEGCRWLGVELDRAANENIPADAREAALISSGSSRARAWVVRTDEERMIARHSLRLASASSDRNASYA